MKIPAVPGKRSDGLPDLPRLLRRHALTDPSRIRQSQHWCPVRYVLFDLRYHRLRGHEPPLLRKTPCLGQASGFNLAARTALWGVAEDQASDEGKRFKEKRSGSARPSKWTRWMNLAVLRCSGCRRSQM
jgi:hypothetical protein